MWRLNALLRMNLPVAVFLNRLAAPRCVFNFGMLSLSLVPLLLCLSRFDLFFRRRLFSDAAGQDRMHLVALLPGRGLGDGHVGEVLDQSLQDAAADFGMRHFAAAEKDRGLDLVAVGQEAHDMVLLELV